MIKLKNCRHSRGSKRKKNKQEAKREGSVKFDRTAKDIERKRRSCCSAAFGVVTG